jgi:hypothetical protein
MRYAVPALLMLLTVSLPALDMPFPKRAKEEWREAINAALAKKADINFDKKPLADCITAIKKLSGVNFVVDPAIAPKPGPEVTLKQKDMLVSEALKQVLAKDGLESRVTDGVIFVYHPKKTDMEMLRPEELPVARMLDGRQEQLDFQPTKEAAGDLLKQLTEPAGITMKMAEELKKVPITLELKNIHLGHALRWLYRFAGGKIEVKTDGMTVVKRGK